jgi:hypothetical protein
MVFRRTPQAATAAVELRNAALVAYPTIRDGYHRGRIPSPPLPSPSDNPAMHVVALAWIYVVLMMVLAEALGPGGSVLGALLTALLYGALPLGLVLYVGGARARARGRRRAAALERAAASEGVDPGGGGQPAGEAVAPVGEEAR